VSRLSDDHRSAGEEMRSVLTWSLVAILIIAIIAIGVFLWAFFGQHYYNFHSY
jgi:hypothetical protein